MQQDLFLPANDEGSLIRPMPGADVTYLADFLSPIAADDYLSILTETLAWRQDHIRLYGKSVKIPRLQAWYGDPGAIYQYSNLTMHPLPWTEALQSLRELCEQACQCRFNSVLANCYRSGADGMSWHADDEPELGTRPVIASVTLGAQRDFDFKHKYTGEKRRFSLAHGSLLIMAGTTQQNWLHALPKRAGETQPRINLTFRQLVSLQNTSAAAPR